MQTHSLLFFWFHCFNHLFQGSVAKNSGIYGFHSPIERAAGMIVLPQVDKYGCQPRNYKKSSKYLDWVALVPRGKCSFYTKITNVRDIKIIN